MSKENKKKKKKKEENITSKDRGWGLSFGEFYYGTEFPQKKFFDPKRYDVGVKGFI